MFASCPPPHPASASDSRDILSHPQDMHTGCKEDDPSLDDLDPVARRRVQNRLAQRRFRSESCDMARGIERGGEKRANNGKKERCRQKLDQTITIPKDDSAHSNSTSTSNSNSTSTSTSTSTSSAASVASTNKDNHALPSFLSLPDGVLPSEKPPLNITVPDDFLLSVSEGIFSPTSSSSLLGTLSLDPDLSHSQDQSTSSLSSLSWSSASASATASQRAVSVPSGASPAWKSPLHVAAQEGHGGIVRLLLEHNADVNAKDSSGATPLAHAIQGGHEATVRLLLSHGAQLDYTDGPGISVFHCAVIYRREALLRLFAEQCPASLALLDAFDGEGVTPLRRAIASGFEAGVRILLNHGASVHR